MAPRLRFAPSPSGYLHIGGARTVLFNWLWARQQGGTFVLRIEDTDQERSSLDSVRAILDAMKWLGLDWDEGPEIGGLHAPYFQSERRHLYKELAEQLIREGKAYRCDLTREELEQLRADFKAKNPKGEFVYRGPVRECADPSKPHVIRFRTPREGSTDFRDKVFGTISTPNSEQPDFVIMRSDGFPLYNFSAVIDDHLMEISLVARGREHIGNTPQQLLLYRAFGWEPPEMAHLPLMLSPSGEKLSKRNASVAVKDYRDRGYTPMGVLNYLARFGWSFGDQEIFSREELIRLFSWDRVGKSDGKFDEKKFADVAFQHLKRPELTAPGVYVQLVAPFLAARGLNAPEPARLQAAIPAIRDRARTLVEAADLLDFFLREPPEMNDAAKALLTPEIAPRLAALRGIFASTEPFVATELEARAKAWIEGEGLKMKDVAQPMRVALTGRTASPGLFDVMVVLGRDVALGRLDRGIRIAQGG
ncbi:MAG TPA: glutamate--tRNA ligase [Polyangiaceae bacterium]|jgi:glutamyl-tRNA synthetase|nr:glutamate--tRNA ligase [Polyangiaceae bacterium]